jgi:alpha-tubulin suppressor-like RCC1 family protein
VQIGAATDWTLTSAGNTHALAIKTTGSLWSWGQNGSGQLGNNVAGASGYRSSPVQVGADINWALAVASTTFSLAIRTTGTMWSWGFNNNGRLGQNNLTDRSSPVQIGAQTDWASVDAGQYASLAIKTTGSLWSWGYNDNGQLGQNNTNNSSSPVQVGSDLDWSQAFSFKHALAIKTNGSLWAWGLNDFGQLGLNDIVNRSSPVQVGAETDWTLVSTGSNFTMALETAPAINPA